MTSPSSSSTFATADSTIVPPERPVLGPAYSVSQAPPPRLSPTQQAAREAILRADRSDEYESVDCPCAGHRGDLLLAEVDRHGLPCRNVICLACGLVRLSPRWRETRYRTFYESEYRSLYNPSPVPKTLYATQVAHSRGTGERARWIRRVARRFGMPEPPRLVEIGAGAGWNLARLPAGWNLVGYDVDQEYLRIGQASLGVEMRHGFVDEALDEIARADLVLLSHVVEHFASPETILQTIRGRLRPGALLLIEVPGLFRLHRSNLDVRSYLQNAHTFTYCGTTLYDACRRAGLEVLDVDQIVRVVCRASAASLDQGGSTRPGLADRIVRYLRLCDAGYRQYLQLRGLPGIGRAAAALWKRTYFASLGALVPKVT